MAAVYGIAPESLVNRRGRWSLDPPTDGESWLRYRAIMRWCVVTSATPSPTVAGLIDYEGYSPRFAEVGGWYERPPVYEWEVLEDSDIPGSGYYTARPMVVEGARPC